ncbi:MAG: LysM domain-containing protein [Rhodanobacter sp.]
MVSLCGQQVKHMAPEQPGSRQQHRQMRVLVLLLLAMFGMAGCAQVNKLKSRVDEQLGPNRTTQPVPAAAPTQIGDSGAFSLTTIINDQLQHGRYAEGEQALHRYLARHPGDRLAQGMLRQVTIDPEKMLGHSSRNYVVQADDSYSSLAARFLGDPNLFLILARYNDSANPSRLRSGETVRLPLSAANISTTREAAVRGANDSQGAELKATGAPLDDSAPAANTEPPTAKAKRLQKESVALLGQGHKQQALARLDEALLINPHLQPTGPGAAGLRQQLVANYHQRAVVLYRDQHLDLAIGLWDHVLAIDPGYEPAVIYRARARELKQRLKQY